jgi:hypothetical protein
LRLAAPQQRLHARQQLGEGEGLDQVVVRALLQALHAVLDLVARGEHQHGHVLRAAYGLQHGEAVDAGQHHVEQDQCVVSLGGEVSALDAVAGYVDDVSVFLQPFFEVIAQFGFVFYDKDSHCRIVPNTSQNTGYDLVILLTDEAPSAGRTLRRAL